MPHKDKRPKLI